MNTRLKLKKELLQYYILQILSEQEVSGALLYKSVKSYIKISLSALYKALYALEEEGKVVSRVDESDKKQKWYSITPRGEAYMEACVYEMENKKKLYQQETRIVRFWAGFLMGLFFLVWFPIFWVAFWLVLALSIVLCAVSFALPTGIAAAFGFLGYKILVYAFTVGMMEGLAAVLLNLLFVIASAVVCIFWLWVMTRFVKWGFRAAGKLFRGLFKFLPVSGS